MSSDFDKMMVQYEAQEKNIHPKGKKVGKGELLLKELLRDGPRPVRVIKMNAILAGISWRIMEKAKIPAGAESFQIRAKGKVTQWMWGLAYPII